MTLMDYYALIRELNELRPHCTAKCTKCGTEMKYSVLEIYCTCSICATKHNVRAMSAELELQDLMIEVVAWLAKNQQLERARQMAEDNS